MDTMVLTYKFRVKGKSANRFLDRTCVSTNTVWNYCNATSFKAIRDNSEWLSEFDLCELTGGTGKELGLHSQTVQAICKEYAIRRKQFKKRKLKWRASRGGKRALGWIPFKASGIKYDRSGFVIYNKRKLRFWNHRELPESAKIKTGSFSQDAEGNWHVSLTCEVAVESHTHTVDDVGIDLGLKDTAVLSTGEVVYNSRSFSGLELSLARAQRAGHKRQARKIHAKIKSRRRDALHKATAKIAKTFKTIYVGDVSGKFLQVTNGKSATDASTGIFRNLLKYKAIRHSGEMIDVSERIAASTVTCSNCFERSGPSGLSDLGVREWKCAACGADHIRDVNAAINHLRLGRETLKPLLAA